MLRTALRPKWLSLLALVLVVSAAFAALGWWQLTSAFQSALAPADEETYARPVPLADLIAPGEGLIETAAGRTIETQGWIDGRDTVVVEGRIQGDQTGYWVVGRLIVAETAPIEGVLETSPTWPDTPCGPADETTVACERPSIPIALGWAADETSAREAATQLQELTPPAFGEAETAATVTVTAQLQPPSEARVPRGDDPHAVLTMAPGQLINTWQEPSPGYYSAYLITKDTDPALELPAQVQPITIVPVDQSVQINMLNIFYAIEWVIFIGMALYIWWRLVRDEYLAEQQAAVEAPQQLEAEIRREKLREIAARRAAAGTDASRKDNA